MKKIICSIAAAIVLCTGARADEGMWLLPLLQELNADAIKDLGCRLTPEQIYSINNSSLKDAIVQFGGGCTGEMISDKGLLVTNHHCGYSSIHSLSTDEHNYLEDGYWAMSGKQELPVPGLSVKFLVSMTDVTDVLEGVRKQAMSEEPMDVSKETYAEDMVKAKKESLIEETKANNPHCSVQITPFFNKNVFYLIVYKTYKDVRFVGAPPASIGKFGGETDNWMWPRHTGDFSMFRVYAGKDNEPAEYSEDNVPYVPGKSLKISLKGVKEGDYTMTMGYPGRTQRFQTVSQLEQMLALHDISIEARTIRQDIMWKWMESDPSIRLKYSNKYAGSSNGWKKWIGQKKAFEDLKIIEREHQKEEDFTKWVNKNKKRREAYGTALQTISEGVAANAEGEKDVQLLAETLFNIELIDLANSFAFAYDRCLKAAPEDTAAAVTDACIAIAGEYESYCEPLDREAAAALLKLYRERAKPDFYPEGLGDGFAQMDIDAYINNLYEVSCFTSSEKLQQAAEKGFDVILGDPAVTLFRSIYNVLYELVDLSSAGDGKIAAGSKAFTAGMLEWKKGEATYPDANFTMRLSYGTVKSYSPKDAVDYRYYTTIYGVIEKEDPDNYEFRVPDRLKQLYQSKDYGQYTMADGNLPTCFITTNDITGGNSGSPVLNADGELIGLAFDGNWEAMSSDVIFEPNLQRCICVDIRYVLFLMDKFGGAGYLLDEMNIVK